MAEIKNFKEYKKAMKEVVAKETNTPLESVKLNDKNCRYWYDQGMPPYFALREGEVEDDCGI